MASPAKLNDDAPGSVSSSSSSMSDRVRDDAPVKPGHGGSLREASDLPTSPVGQSGGKSPSSGAKGPKAAESHGSHAGSAAKKSAAEGAVDKAIGGNNPATDKATSAVANKLPGGVDEADKGGAEKVADKAAGAAATALTGSQQAGQLAQKIGVRRIAKYSAISILISMLPAILLGMIIAYVVTHPWDAVKDVIMGGSFRRFASAAAGLAVGEGSNPNSIVAITGKLPHEVDYKPGSAIAATQPVATPEPGTLEDTIWKIDYETSRNKFKQSKNRCPYVVKTKLVASADGKTRSVIDKVTDRSGKKVDLSNPEVFNCVLEQYPILETMIRSPQARKINQQMQVNLSYAEEKDSDLVKGKSSDEVSKVLYKKSLDKVWKNSDSPFGSSTECVADFQPTGKKIDRAIKKAVNDLACGTKPENIKVDYRVEEIPKELDTDSTKYERRLIQYTKTACTFYEKLNKEKDNIKKYQLNRAKSSARAGVQALTLADTGVAGDISSEELNGDFYKIANFAGSRAYQKEVNGTSGGVQADPESIPTRVLGLTRDYFEELATERDLKYSLGDLCEKQDDLDSPSSSGGFGGFLGAIIGKINNINNVSYAEDIEATLDYLRRDISRQNKSLYPKASDVTLNDIITRTIKITSNASNSGVEDGPDNFNRMMLGAKGTTYNYTLSLLGGSYETATEGNQASLQVEATKRKWEKQAGIAYRLFNTDNPRSIASRLAAETTATPSQVAEKTTRYAVNMLNPVRAFAEINTMIAYVGYGENNRAIAAVDDDREYWKLDTTGIPQTEDAIPNARYIEALKKKVADPAYKNDATIQAVAASFAAWDKCMETYYPDMQTLDDNTEDRACQIMRKSARSKTIASSYSVSSSKYNLPQTGARLASSLSAKDEKALANSYAKYKGHMNFYGAWARLSSKEEDKDMYANTKAGGTGAAQTGPVVEGITYPPNLAGAINGTGYYTMPESQPPGLYVFSGNDRCGSKELVGTIYTVAQQWAKTYPGSTLRIGDLNAGSGHVSHKKGVDVDITVTDQSAANVNGDRNKSIQLGKWFIDTGIIKMILYNDTAVQAAVNEYAKSVGKPGIMKYWAGHDTHFHVRISDQYVQPESLGCPR